MRSSAGLSTAEPPEAGHNDATPSQFARLRAENEQLRRETDELRAQLAAAAKGGASSRRGSSVEEADGDGESDYARCSEGRLRSLLTRPATTPDQLRRAIAGAEALIEEAKRELAAKQLRERRAAYERLHTALERASTDVDEEQLASALLAAHAAGLDSEDVEKGEAMLAELRALTDEERAARANREAESRRRKEAFLLVKKDNADALVNFLDALEEGTRWQDWRDYAGRTLRRCAQDLRAFRVQEVLAQREAAEKPKPSPFSTSLSVATSMTSKERKVAKASDRKEPERPKIRQLVQLDGSQDNHGKRGSVDGSDGIVSAMSNGSLNASNSEAPADSDSGAREGDELLKAKALRAAVQDDCVALAEVLELTPTDVWSKWVNKAGQDLLTLSQVRGATSAYAILAKALGIVHEMKREAFEERETVWVFLPGEVQPRRATVLEDTPEEADEIYLEYWEGDSPAEYVERCMVRRMWS